MRTRSMMGFAPSGRVLNESTLDGRARFRREIAATSATSDPQARIYEAALRGRKQLTVDSLRPFHVITHSNPGKGLHPVTGETEG